MTSLPAYLLAPNGFKNYQRIVSSALHNYMTLRDNETDGEFDEISTRYIQKGVRYLRKLKTKQGHEPVETLAKSWDRPWDKDKYDKIIKGNPFLMLVIQLQVIVTYHDNFYSYIEDRANKATKKTEVELWSDRHSALELFDYTFAEILLIIVQEVMQNEETDGVDEIGEVLCEEMSEDDFCLMD